MQRVLSCAVCTLHMSSSFRRCRVGPLYEHIWPPRYSPRLSFVGLPWKVSQSTTVSIARDASCAAVCSAPIQHAAAVQPQLTPVLLLSRCCHSLATSCRRHG